MPEILRLLVPAVFVARTAKLRPPRATGMHVSCCFRPACELEELRALTAQLQAELYAKNVYIEKLKAQLATLKRARFGRSSEKLDRLIEQLELTITDLEEGEAQADVEQTQDRSSVSPPTLAAKTKPALGRKPLPNHLPSETITHPPVCSCPNCGGTVFSKIGTDEREVLEYVPSHFKRVVHLRPKMSCRACETIVQAPMPSLPIERGRPGPNLLAHILVSKYCDHLPLHRQSDIFAREGIDLDRSTLAGWVGAMAALLKILCNRIGAHVRAGETVQADDTPVPVLDPGCGSDQWQHRIRQGNPLNQVVLAGLYRLRDRRAPRDQQQCRRAGNQRLRRRR